jgi:hypothetical protein
MVTYYASCLEPNFVTNRPYSFSVVSTAYDKLFPTSIF